jgi:hypothetical protein
VNNILEDSDLTDAIMELRKRQRIDWKATAIKTLKELANTRPVLVLGVAARPTSGLENVYKEGDTQDDDSSDREVHKRNPHIPEEDDRKVAARRTTEEKIEDRNDPEATWEQLNDRQHEIDLGKALESRASNHELIKSLHLNKEPEL